MNTATQNVSEAVAAESMTKKEFQQVALQEVKSVGGMRLALNTFAEMEKFANFMAISNFVPKHLRSKPADCLAVLLQSMRWEMDPFAVAQKTYFVNDGMAYEAQLVNAIVLARAQLKSRPKITWDGEGENITCTVSAVFEGEDEPREFTAENKTITTRNSPLWKQQPKQQLAYFALRAWARLYCPDVLMGIYTKEEMEDQSFMTGPGHMVDVTPAANDTIANIEAAIAAEKTAMQQAEPETFDKQTGEIKSEKKAASKDEVPAYLRQPRLIAAAPLKGDATKTDWKAFAEAFEGAVGYMVDEQSIEKLKTMNKRNLDLLEVQAADLYESVIQCLTMRSIDIEKGKAA